MAGILSLAARTETSEKPLGACAMIVSSSSDNSKFRLEPKPWTSDTPEQAIMLIFGHHQEVAWCWRILRRMNVASFPNTWCQLVGLDAHPVIPVTELAAATEPSPEALRFHTYKQRFSQCDNAKL